MGRKRVRALLPPIDPAAIGALFDPDAKLPEPPPVREGTARPDAVKICSVAGCQLVVRAKGKCQPHYDQERSKGRIREDRVLENRARNRATSALVKAHRKEFEQLLAQAKKDVAWENARIVKAAQKAGVKVDGKRALRLKPGPPATGESTEKRIKDGRVKDQV